MSKIVNFECILSIFIPTKNFHLDQHKSLYRMDEARAIVIDNGSFYIKSGYGGVKYPRDVSVNYVGRPKYDHTMGGLRKQDVYLCDKVFDEIGILRLQHPIHRGVVTNWSDMVKIWHHVFRNELRVDPSEHPLLLTATAMNSRNNCEKMAQIMFETFGVPSLNIVNQSYLSLMGTGRKTGVVLSIGDGVCEVVPVYDGFILVDSIVKQDFAGRDLTKYLGRILTESGYYFGPASSERELLRDMKEKFCYVADNFCDEIAKTRTYPYEHAVFNLPDGNVICFADQRFRCPELLFNPPKHLNILGIHQMVVKAIMKCDEDIRKDLFANIILSGGSSMFKGLPEHLSKEITASRLVSPTTEVRVVADNDRKYITWMGGSVFTSLDAFPRTLLTHEEYSDAGSAIVHRKSWLNVTSD